MSVAGMGTTGRVNGHRVAFRSRALFEHPGIWASMLKAIRWPHVAGTPGIDRVEPEVLADRNATVARQLQAGGHLFATATNGIYDVHAVAWPDVGVASIVQALHSSTTHRQAGCDRPALPGFRYTAFTDTGSRRHEFQPDTGNQQFVTSAPGTALAQQRDDPNNA
jgi:hypothetical protein